MLEIQAETHQERNRPRIEIVVDASEDLGIDTGVFGEAESIVHGAVDTAADAVITVALEELVETVPKGDVVTLQERSVLQEIVGENPVV